MNIEVKKSNFSGFIDGYKAGNLATFSATFRRKKSEMDKFVEMIIENEKEAEKEVTDHLMSLSNLLKSIAEDYEGLYLIGDKLLFIITFKDFSDKLKGENIFPLFKKVVYNFVELAKCSEDPKAMDIAISIGNII
ncbi:MAG: hypothetical protein JEZ11_05230 [Desulfobacterales bacterium]|nr:hypothetical protein [Desulfobacterales bacterium]